MAENAKTTTHDEDCRNPFCEICQNKRDFELPAQLVKALLDGKLVVFAGAGISTETRDARSRSFYENIHAELRTHSDDRPTFAELMTRYSEAKGRMRLLQEIKKHIEYGNIFSEVYVAATRFHRELSTIPFLKEIYTTNWDDYFETICQATPYVTADDFAFWELPGRKVFKLHGSIHNIGSMIITTDDYQRCYQTLRDGLIGSSLKLALATKTILFLGYSLADEDFLRIWKLVHDELGDNVPCSYWVTLNASSFPGALPKGLQAIETDASYFISKLKSHLIQTDIMLPDDRWEVVKALREKVQIEHGRLFERFRLNKNPEMVFSAFYQDGMMHACDSVISHAFAGEASHHCYYTQKLNAYDKLRKEKLRNRNYGDVAYIEGFMNGMLYAAIEEKSRKHLPMYFLFGRVGEMRPFAQYCRMRRHARELHKRSFRWAQRVAELYKDAQGSISLHHRPFL